VVNPIGYISKTGVEGMRSLTGPRSRVRFLKSMTLGGWRSIRSGRGILEGKRVADIRIYHVTFLMSGGRVRYLQIAVELNIGAFYTKGSTFGGDHHEKHTFGTWSFGVSRDSIVYLRACVGRQRHAVAGGDDHQANYSG